MQPARPPLPDIERQALAHAVHETYMEIFPSPSIEQRLDSLEPGAYVAVTCSPRSGVDETMNCTARLTARGFRVVPHIAAKMVRDKDHLQQIMGRLADCGVESIFVPGGDAPRPIGNYTTALQLLRDIADFDHRLRHIGVAAHPEGHPAVDAETLLQELSAKQQFATYLVTQMCFDAAAISAWLAMIRARGITLAAWIGLPGVFDRAALIEASLRIGVGASLRLLRQRGQVVRRLFGPKIYRPDVFLFELAPRLAELQLGISGFHLFCFNKVTQSEEWRRRLVADLQHGT